VSTFADNLARLQAAATEYRAAAIGLRSWLSANGQAPSEEVDALSTVETIAAIFETANGGASALVQLGPVQRHNAERVHGDKLVADAVRAGRLAAQADCPCPTCTCEIAEVVTAAQAICARALATGASS
jgi:hypothetical protein